MVPGAIGSTGFAGPCWVRYRLPLPKHYLLGFDEQKLETEGIPEYFLNPNAPIDDSKLAGYSVYLDGKLRRGGWWYYYPATLAYKVARGDLVVGRALRVCPWSPRSAPGRHGLDEIAVLAFPVGFLGAMTFLTDICLGLRYILPIFPYVFIATGKVVPWVIALDGWWKRAAWALVGSCLVATSTATVTIHPHYLSYFNWASGGPDRGAEHLIDSKPRLGARTLSP